jgi:hypothetical protein
LIYSAANVTTWDFGHTACMWASKINLSFPPDRSSLWREFNGCLGQHVTDDLEPARRKNRWPMVSSMVVFGHIMHAVVKSSPWFRDHLRMCDGEVDVCHSTRM